MTNTCKHCVWFDKRNKNLPLGFGDCLNNNVGLTAYNHEPLSKACTTDSIILYDTEDGCHNFSVLIVGENFGCVHFVRGNNND